MTVDQTIRAALHVVTTMIAEITEGLLSGQIDPGFATERLADLEGTLVMLEALNELSGEAPADYERYACPGGEANRPSLN
jgi:hypothetical protein